MDVYKQQEILTELAATGKTGEALLLEAFRLGREDGESRAEKAMDYFIDEAISDIEGQMRDAVRNFRKNR